MDCGVGKHNKDKYLCPFHLDRRLPHFVLVR